MLSSEEDFEKTDSKKTKLKWIVKIRAFLVLYLETKELYSRCYVCIAFCIICFLSGEPKR